MSEVTCDITWSIVNHAEKGKLKYEYIFKGQSTLIRNLLVMTEKKPRLISHPQEFLISIKVLHK